MPKFFIEQIALCPIDPEKARALLAALGLDDWVFDTVDARGSVYGVGGLANTAHLAFNYQAEPPKPLELEILHYVAGHNWMVDNPPSVSHLGMHCTEAELLEFKEQFEKLGISVAQEVFTTNHVNPAIAGKRWYSYTIFNTRDVLGVDLKFIVRRETAPPNG